MKRLNKIKLKYFIILIIILIAYFILSRIGSTLMRYYMEITGSVVGYGASEEYTITYNLDNGTQAVGQIETYTSSDLPITLLEPTKSGYTFQGWFNNSGLTGDPITKITTVGNYTLFAKWVDERYVAEVNGNYYETVNEAIYRGVPFDGTPTVVKILKDVSISTNNEFDPSKTNTYPGRITPQNGQNVILNIGNHMLTNTNGVNTPIIENYGTLTISEGTIKTSAQQGAINNNTNGSLYITGTTVVEGSGRQAIYNFGGYAEISGNPKLTTTSNNRAAVHNKSGTMKILGGTIDSSRYYGVQIDAGSVTIGAKDGTVSASSPSIKGTYGVYSSVNYNFYDGIIKGSTLATNNNNRIVDVETDYELVSGTEKINNTLFKTIYLLDDPVTVTFNANGGTVDEPSRSIEHGTAIGTLPIPTYTGQAFDGWFTDPNDGDEINENTIIDENIEVFAHWHFGVAEVNGVKYGTIEEALSHVPTDGTPTTVNILDDIIVTNASTNATTGGRIKITTGMNVTLNIGNNTLKNKTGISTPVIENTGTLTIINGTVFSDSEQGAINNNKGGVLIISGGNITAIGSRQALYNDGGTATITGTANLTSVTDERATVHNINNGRLTIIGGTISSSGGLGLFNEGGTVTIGSDDGTIAQTPTIRGITYGAQNNSTMSYYDGIIYGVNDAFDTISANTTIPNTCANHHIDTSATEIIDGTTYIKATIVADSNNNNTNAINNNILNTNNINSVINNVDDTNTDTASNDENVEPNEIPNETPNNISDDPSDELSNETLNDETPDVSSDESSNEKPNNPSDDPSDEPSNETLNDETPDISPDESSNETPIDSSNDSTIEGN